MVWLTLTSGAWTNSAAAASLEAVLMPGPLSRAHAKFEDDCTQCHNRLDRSKQTSLCVDCHKPIGADIRDQKGLHGKVAQQSNGKCTACHSEHLGRNGDIVRFNHVSFDHQLTNFPLRGAHASTDCRSCHKAAKAWRAAPTVCADCHKADDIHAGQLDHNCGSCHGSLSWAGARFDHDKSKFPLREAHREARCNTCHFGNRYRGAPTTCIACHAPDDAHRGARGEKCGECHNQSSWSATKFDHSKTGFPLSGAHKSIDCGACHRSGKFEDKLPKTCSGCHRAEDSHAGRFGENCDGCHDTSKWAGTQYDHTIRAKFELTGAHKKLDCHTCHTAVQSEQKLGSDCANCHRADDPHGGALTSGCETCHGVDSWRQDIRFDHDLGDYPLLGMHALVTCAQCHTSKVFKGAPTTCISCHANNDVHKGGLGKDCAACHTPNAWAVWEFDHGSQTGFALTGQHGRLRCVDCHRQPAGEIKLAKECVACHRKDDRHLGQFGTQCQRCHTTLSFKGARIQ
jgi:hypothetical protein